jgi:hypothetical protein
MGATTPRAQRVLQWTHDVQWDDLPEPIRPRVRTLLVAVLRHAASVGARREEHGHDQQ